ncbi:hypothetical protein [Anabaena sp. CS-542/02]|uniref:hypothetical protein n=1 Tax=Anabaena sp. CS-542/02 TaxID=3021719 RepID=UPI0023301336|nr:hypothetical protein [Anabaena sp. CS-542/02]MDB9445877.1 hypothetical protein [Anabaena sp. CS-542/02]
MSRETAIAPIPSTPLREQIPVVERSRNHEPRNRDRPLYSFAYAQETLRGDVLKVMINVSNIV